MRKDHRWCINDYNGIYKLAIENRKSDILYTWRTMYHENLGTIRIYDRDRCVKLDKKVQSNQVICDPHKRSQTNMWSTSRGHVALGQGLVSPSKH